MKQKIFSTHNGYIGLIIRLTTGIIIFTHGARALLGWFGGFGFVNKMVSCREAFICKTEHAKI